MLLISATLKLPKENIKLKEYYDKKKEPTKNNILKKIIFKIIFFKFMSTFTFLSSKKSENDLKIILSKADAKTKP